MTEESLQALLDDMTIEEKIGQLNQVVGLYFDDNAVLTGPVAEKLDTNMKAYLNLSGSVLGLTGARKLKDIQKQYMDAHPHNIPLLFMGDIINGFSTIFPIPLGQGCTFDPELVERGAAVAALEAAVSGLHVTFSPMADLVRDARWGRVMEATGEDPYLNGLYAAAMVQGYQGACLKEQGRIAACVKHFAAYGAPTAGRDYNNVELSKRTFLEDYLPAYKAAIDSGCELVMISFNSINRIPVTADEELVQGILRDEFGFDGVVISDWQAIEELMAHTIAADGKEAAELAMNAGVDIDMMSGLYIDHMDELIEKKEINPSLLNDAVMRILKLKNKLGLFENPYKDGDEESEKRIILSSANQMVARELAVKSFVLLKNEGEILPLSKDCMSIAFLGPYIDNKKMYGSWSIYGDESAHVTIKEAVEAMVDQKFLSFAKGCSVLGPGENFGGMEDLKAEDDKDINDRESINEAVSLAAGSDVVVLALGEHYLQSGEARSRAEITLPAIQLQFLREIHKVNTRIVVVLFNGRPLDLREIQNKAMAVLDVWLPGTQGGNAIADVLFGKEVPSGKLSMSFPRCVGQTPIFYNDFTTGRPYTPGKNKDYYRSHYIDMPNTPLFPFGYGLSFTTFEYSDMKLTKSVLHRSQKMSLFITVKNTGEFEGEEIVQLYIHDDKGSVIRPIKELKGFKKIWLTPGESEEVEFVINEEMLKFYRKDYSYHIEEGWFTVYVGTNSRDTLEARFYLSCE